MSTKTGSIVGRIARNGVALIRETGADRMRSLSQGLYDAFWWVIALVGGFVVRTAFVTDAVGDTVVEPYTFRAETWMLVAIAVVCQLGLGRLVGLYIRRWRYGTLEETEALMAVVVMTTAVVFAANNLLGGLDAASNNRAVPNSVALASGLVVLASTIFARNMWRLGIEALQADSDRERRAIIFGAGSAGRRLVNLLLDDPTSDFWPVALIDDDPSMKNMRIRGIQVAGTASDIERAKDKFNADTLIVAVKDPDGPLLRSLTEQAMDAGLDLRILPPASEILGSKASASDIRPVTEADLLGRREIDTDIDAVAGYITGKRVLVTGAGGSIGSELCRQINRFGPSALVMLDRDETALHDVQLSIDGRGLLDSRDLVVADIRDGERIDEVFDEHRPEVVFHAAALKHLPLLEMHPGEGFKTNVIGTLNLLEAASRHSVERFVNVSTDKAADPTSVLGRTKRLAERLTAERAAVTSGRFMSVRFGNVLGSRGSVLPTFRRQLAAGGPLTVTHEDVTRYFMTVEEACQLVIQAGAIGSDGQAMVLDMGEPVKIMDVARRLVSQSDRPVPIVVTGLRPGEKLHEVLQAHDEVDHRPIHPLISHVDVPPIAASVVRMMDPVHGASATIDLREAEAAVSDVATRG